MSASGAAITLMSARIFVSASAVPGPNAAVGKNSDTVNPIDAAKRLPAREHRRTLRSARLRLRASGIESRFSATSVIAHLGNPSLPPC